MSENWNNSSKSSCLSPFVATFSAPTDKEIRKAQALKDEGNALVKKGEHKKAIEKYSQSLKHNPKEVTTYTNRWALSLCWVINVAETDYMYNNPLTSSRSDQVRIRAGVTDMKGSVEAVENLHLQLILISLNLFVLKFFVHLLNL